MRNRPASRPARPQVAEIASTHGDALPVMAGARLFPVARCADADAAACWCQRPRHAPAPGPARGPRAGPGRGAARGAPDDELSVRAPLDGRVIGVVDAELLVAAPPRWSRGRRRTGSKAKQGGRHESAHLGRRRRIVHAGDDPRDRRAGGLRGGRGSGRRRRSRRDVEAAPPGHRDDGHRDAEEVRDRGGEEHRRARSEREDRDVQCARPGVAGDGGAPGRCEGLHREALQAGRGGLDAAQDAGEAGERRRGHGEVPRALPGRGRRTTSPR